MKKIILAVAVAAVATMAVVSSASADVARYQTSAGTLTVNLPQYGLVHTFKVDLNPCDNSFTGTGASQQGPFKITETIDGSLIGGLLSFKAAYTGDAAVLALLPGYQWFTTAPGATTNTSIPAVDTQGTHFNVTWTLGNMTQSNYKNHGEYVSSQGGGSDAAHSCIGMPIH